MSFSIHNSIRLPTVALGLAVSVVGCGRLHTGEAEGDVCNGATVYFSNESLDEAAVYAVSGSQQVRIGTVMAGRSDTLALSPTSLSNGTVYFVVRPLASSRVVSSGPVALHGCDAISLRLPSVQNTIIVLPPRS